MVSRRGNPNMFCLPLKLLPDWLFGIDTTRIKELELREWIIVYWRECYDRLSVTTGAKAPRLVVVPAESSMGEGNCVLFGLKRLGLRPPRRLPVIGGPPVTHAPAWRGDGTVH